MVTVGTTPRLLLHITYGHFNHEPVTMCMQEFLPAAKPVGCNELEVATRLSGMPDFKWQAAAAGLSADPPVTPILGAFALSSSPGTVLSSTERHWNTTKCAKKVLA